MLTRTAAFGFGLALLALVSAPAASAASFTGSFATDDQVQLFQVDVASPGDVLFRTWSFAGGTNAESAVIPGGGFAPILSLFGPDGVWLVSDGGGTFGDGCTRSVDSSSGFAWDACVSEDNLPAGHYTLALTEDDNSPLGPTLADGFSRAGQGDFTGPLVFGDAGGGLSFLLITGEQRTPEWAVDITGDGIISADEIGAVPEPNALILLLSGLAGILAFWKRKA